MKSSSITCRRRDSQGGYALLMVFLMAAIVALMLYQQLPRVAFESEREKEQLLIDRGEQYTRAIQLYYLANNRQWPTSIDDLEKREKRFLRRRYVDPYTGKDEWRIIHTTGGFLTDSLVQKPPGTSDSQNASNPTGNTSTTASTDGQPPQVNAAVLQRPSDRPVTPPGFEPPVIVQDPSAQPGNAPNAPLPPITLQAQGPGALPPITLQPGGVNQPGLPPITLVPAGAQQGGQLTPGQPGARPPQFPGQFPGQNQGAPFQAFPGQPVPGQPVPGQPVPGQPVPGQPVPGQPVLGLPGGGTQTAVPPGFRIDTNGQLVPIAPVPGQQFPGQPQGFPGAIPGQPLSPQPPNQQNQPNQSNQQFQNQPGPAQGSPNTALNLINQLLTSPRQTTTPIQTGGNQTGGIAGIASTHKGPSIKVYKDQKQYELWEFVFTPIASTVPGGGASGVGAPGGIPGGGPGGGPGGRGGANPVGGQPGNANQPGLFGGPGAFNPGGGQGGPGQPGAIFQTPPPSR